MKVEERVLLSVAVVDGTLPSCFHASVTSATTCHPPRETSAIAVTLTTAPLCVSLISCSAHGRQHYSHGKLINLINFSLAVIYSLFLVVTFAHINPLSTSHAGKPWLMYKAMMSNWILESDSSSVHGVFFCYLSYLLSPSPPSFPVSFRVCLIVFLGLSMNGHSLSLLRKY